MRLAKSTAKNYFYPRPPRGGRLDALYASYNKLLISIHALREEGDRTARKTKTAEGRFLSTPSARRATG